VLTYIFYLSVVRLLLLSIHSIPRLLTAGYSLDEIAASTLEVERCKKMRADSLRSAGWANPWEMLSGVVETTGTALKRVDVLGVGAGVGAVVGVGAAVGYAAGSAVGSTIQGAGGLTVQSGRFLVSGVQSSSRVVGDVASGVAGGVVGAGKAVAKPVVGVTKNVVVRPVGKGFKVVGTGVVTTGRFTGRVVGTGMATTGRAIGSVVSPIGRALGSFVNSGPVAADPWKDNSPSKDNNPKPKETKRRPSLLLGQRKDLLDSLKGGSSHESKRRPSLMLGQRKDPSDPSLQGASSQESPKTAIDVQ
jgi:hypothetical protein